jgi:hypothetical protein
VKGAPTYRSFAGASRHCSKALLAPPRVYPCWAALVRASRYSFFFSKKVPDSKTSKFEKHTDFKKFNLKNVQISNLLKFKNCSN